jgi:hypothetical protein
MCTDCIDGGFPVAELMTQLAANGPTIVTKMRLVAVTLLDALAPSPTQDGTGQDRSAYLLGKLIEGESGRADWLRLPANHVEHRGPVYHACLGPLLRSWYTCI